MSCPRPPWLVDRRSGTQTQAAGSDLLARLCAVHLRLGLRCFFLLLVGGSQPEKELQPTSGWGARPSPHGTIYHSLARRGAEKGKTGTTPMGRSRNQVCQLLSLEKGRLGLEGAGG